ncbi:UDP-glucosyltransferase 2-like [Homalodisca vitripennis]|uniref:UDP-glucosyltransferase 2-like n=1 Tax=Homalodisca vitripennis TaxID=197043 RepID=UPI001EEA30A0|nr:UDP-glucosyltransferase 2-like [Homalodisca vitripennis]
MFVPVMLVIATFTSICNGANILALLPVNCRSHFLVMEPLLLELHQRGHRLTVVSSFPQKTTMANYTDIDFSPQIPPLISVFTPEVLREKTSNVIKSALFITEIHMTICEQLIRHEKVINLLNETFDLIIGEIFGSDCLNYIVYKLNAPFISWVVSTSSPWSSYRTGLPDNPSYIPNYFVDYGDEMNFVQRAISTVSLFTMKVLYYYYSELPSQRLAEEVFNENLPSLDEVNRQTSLVLVNSHFVFSQSRPFPPSVVEVGGIHIRDIRPLPKDIKEFLDGAKDGVVLVSFGSLVRMAALPPRVIRMFLEVFSTLPQRFILKYEDELPNTPPNVMIKKWIPQLDITAHPNVRAIIAHGGLASTTEAVHFAKPLVLIPFYTDQYQNANNIIRRGGGILLDISNLSQRDISQALTTVLNDASYTMNMRRLSQKFRDRPMTPLQTAVYWTEYVIRHQGAPHLRPASVNLPLYQYLLLDVIAILAILLAAVFCIVHYIMNLISNLN